MEFLISALSIVGSPAVIAFFKRCEVGPEDGPIPPNVEKATGAKPQPSSLHAASY